MIQPVINQYISVYRSFCDFKVFWDIPPCW